jgi:hypothetical protein
MTSPFTAPASRPRNGITTYTAADLQPALNALQWRDGPSAVRRFQAECTAGPTIGTSAVDIAGCSVTFTVTGSNAFAVVTGTFGWSISTSNSTAVASGLCVVDGVTQPRAATKSLQTPDAFTGSQVWSPVLAAGSHTIKLQVVKDLVAGTIALDTTNTVLTVLLIDHR